LRDANDVIVAAARGLVMHDGGMKLGCLGRRFIAFSWVASMVVVVGGAGSCGHPLKVVRPPPALPRGGVAFAVNYPTYTMRNGLVVVLAPDDESNLVTVDVRYHVGAADEIAGKTGLAHLAEHLTFEAVPAGAATRETLTARLGEASLSFNARTTLDSTHYYAVGLQPSLESLLAIEAQRMTSTCGQLSDELFARERAVVMQELAQRAEGADVVKSLHRLVWGADHPFAHGVGGDDVATLTRDDYCAFTARYYIPANATLVVGGHVDPKKAQKLIEQYFDRIPRVEPAFDPAHRGLPEAGRTQMSEISVEYPTAMVVFPLMPAGTARRMHQDVLIALIELELAKRVEDRADLVDGATLVIGGQQQGAVALRLSGKTASHEMLIDEIHSVVATALEIGPGPRIQYLQARLLTRVAAAHDNMLERGSLIGDHSQFIRNDHYASQAEAISDLTAEGLRETGARTFRRLEARTFLFEKREKISDAPALANAGEKHLYDLPPRAQLSTAVSSSLPIGQLAPQVTPVDFKLRNGLRVILVPRRSEAFFDARLVLPIGDADDPDDRPGTAELTATMLEPPRDKLDVGIGMLMRTAALAGGALTAETTPHTTTFRIRGVASAAVLHMWRLHVLLESGEHYAEDLEELRKARAEREREEKEQAADPDVIATKRKARLWRALLGKMLGEDYPLLRDRGGDRSRISVADLKAFRKAHYRIKGAVLVVVGGFDKAELAREIYTLWGAWPSEVVPRSRSLPPARPQPGRSYLALDRPDTQVSLSLAFAARSDPERDAGARLVAIELLRDRVSEIRERLAATYGLDVEYVRLPSTSFVVVVGRVAPDRGVEVLAALREAWNLDRHSDEQLALEVARARRRALQRALAQSSSSASIADSIADLAITGKRLDEQQQQAAAIAAVTTEQVRAVIEGDLDPSRMVVAASGPGASEMLRAAGASKVEVIP
jgi:zinc protease